METGERPGDLSPIESVAFASFLPDLGEAWDKYVKRVSSGAKGGRPKGEKPYGSICPHTVPYGIEVEEDSKKELSPLIPQRGKRSRFVPPSVEDVSAYCMERQNGIDPEEFVAFYASKGWRVGTSPMKSWKSAVITWEKKRLKDRKEVSDFGEVL